MAMLLGALLGACLLAPQTPRPAHAAAPAILHAVAPGLARADEPVARGDPAPSDQPAAAAAEPAPGDPRVLERELDALRALTRRLRRAHPERFGGEGALGPRAPGDDDAASLERLLARELLLLEQTVARLEAPPQGAASGALAASFRLEHLERTYTVELPADTEVRDVALVIENLGRAPLVAPRVTRSDEPAWHDLPSLVRAAVGDARSPAERAQALWRFVVEGREHGPPATEGAEPHDPVELLGVYGYGLCDDAATAYVHLARAAGLEARLWALGGHVVPEVRYDDAWHAFDPDHELFQRDAEGRVLGVEQLAAGAGASAQVVRVPGRAPRGVDPDKRAAILASTGDNRVVPVPELASPHTLDVVLRAGERVVRWYHDGPRRLAVTRFERPALAGHGEWIHERVLDAPSTELDYALPWPILGGRVELASARDGASDLVVEARDPSGAWLPVGRAALAEGAAAVDLDAFLTGAAAPRHALVLRVRCDAAALPAAVQVVLAFQHAPRVLPALRPGANTLRWTSRGGAARVTHLYRVH